MFNIVVIEQVKDELQLESTGHAVLEYLKATAPQGSRVVLWTVIEVDLTLSCWGGAKIKKKLPKIDPQGWVYDPPVAQTS